MLDIQQALRVILQRHELPWYGLHGISHWGRVLDNGLRIAEETGANRRVITLFALFHDSQRISDGNDPGHGQRGAYLAAELRGTLFQVTDLEFSQLHDACSYHTQGRIDGEPTVQACWDADRLDLGRVGVRPDPNRMGTDIARTSAMIQWAHQRAEQEFLTETIAPLWEELSDQL